MDMDPSLLVPQFNDAPPPSPFAAAANPSPGAGAGLGTPASHPSYVEMITAAVEWGSSQGKEGGSSKRAIAKYIDRVYTNLPASHSALLTHHLQRLKNSGQLVMVKNSYQLASAVRSVPARGLSGVVEPTSTKRGRGRPPKEKVVVEMEHESDPDAFNGSGSGSGSEVVKKRRGRPPRWTQEDMVATEVPFVQPISEARPTGVVNGEASLGGQKRRGRPPKVQAVEVEPQPLEFLPVVPFAPEDPEEGQVNEEVTVKRRGRPPKQVSSVDRVMVMSERPAAEGSVRPRGRPRKNVLGPVVSTRPVGKRQRGRPKMMGGALSGAVGIRIGMHRGRGRPPKGGGPPMPRRKPGRPAGRPRKDDNYILKNSHTVGYEVANEELLRKFELIQSKIREAVIVIRPCVADESPALIALQQLQELATMDLPAPQDAPQDAPSETMAIPQSPPTPAVNVSAPFMGMGAGAGAGAPFMGAGAPFMGGPPSMGVGSPFMGAPFTVNATPGNASAPFHGAPSGIETQHPMSWFSSHEKEAEEKVGF